MKVASLLLRASLSIALAACLNAYDTQARALAIWKTHMTAIDREISILEGDSKVTLTNEELEIAFEFLGELTGIKAPVSYSPAGPIVELEDLRKARQQWRSWVSENGQHLVVDPKTGNVTFDPSRR